MATTVQRVAPPDWSRMRDVRLAALTEAPAMFGSDLAREQAFDDAEWRRRAARPATFLASRDGIDVGMAGAYDLDGGWWLMGMWIAPAARGTGVVDVLVAACEDAARAAGATELTLGVIADNVRGVRAYARHGYLETGVVEVLADGRRELVLRKSLGAAASLTR